MCNAFIILISTGQMQLCNAGPLSQQEINAARNDSKEVKNTPWRNFVEQVVGVIRANITRCIWGTSWCILLHGN